MVLCSSSGYGEPIERYVEILVHATAPSRGTDDANYRSLARACLNFEPASRLDLEEEVDNLEYVDEAEANSQLLDELEQSTQEERESAASYRPDEEEPASLDSQRLSPQHHDISQEVRDVFPSPVLSFNSVMDNVNSPVFRGRVTRAKRPKQGHSQNSTDSWSNPPSTVADSQPDASLNMRTRQFPSPSKMLETYKRKIDESKTSSCGDGHSWRGNHKYTGERGRNELSGFSIVERSLSFDRPISDNLRSPLSPQTECSQSSGRALRSKNKYSPSSDHQQSQNSTERRNSIIFSDGPISSLPLPSPVPLSTLADQTQRPYEYPAKRQCTEVHLPVTDPQILASSKTTETVPPSSGNKSLWFGKLEIRPPPPSVSTANLHQDELITPSLIQLQERMPMSKLFQPHSKTRDLRPMERGYWLIECSKWTAELRDRFWDCLGNFVGRGQGGWGVWCVRDDQFDTARVYCWGNVVAQIYLLIWMASESKIKGTGASWIGGDGSAVVTMPS